MLEVELLRRLDSRYVPVPVDFVEGVGLDGFELKPFAVAEWGIRGGGIESCLGRFPSVFSPLGCLPPFFDALLLNVKLSLRLIELIDEGVGGSSGLERGGGDFAAGFVVVAVVFGFCARGPWGLCTE